MREADLDEEDEEEDDGGAGPSHVPRGFSAQVDREQKMARLVEMVWVSKWT